MTTLGADPEQLDDLSRCFNSLAERLDTVSSQLGVAIGRTAWHGHDADQFRGDWSRHFAPTLGRVAWAMRAEADVLRRNADEQRHASGSAGSVGSVSPSLTPPGWNPTEGLALDDTRAAKDALRRIDQIVGDGPGRFDLDHFHHELDQVKDLLGDLSPEERVYVMSNLGEDKWRIIYDQMTESGAKGGYNAAQTHDFLAMFVPHMSTDGVRRLLGDDWALASNHGSHLRAETQSDFDRSFFDTMASKRDKIPKDEIEIQKLNNGRYVVVLPGIVNDLGLDFVGMATGRGAAELASWGDRATSHHESGSARTLRNAQAAEFGPENASVSGANGYAFAVKEAMRHAGVPDGADVMIVGHSHGAYTALDLAADPGFNEVQAGGDVDGYSVRITHAVAAAAEAGTNLERVSGDVKAHLVKNDHDYVRVAEDAVGLDANHNPRTSTFNGAMFGHNESEYAGFMGDRNADGLNTSNGAALDSIMSDAESYYNDNGERIRVKVKDPYALH